MNGLRVRGSITSLVTDQPRFNQSLDAAKYGSPKWNEVDIREAFFAYRMLSGVFGSNTTEFYTTIELLGNLSSINFVFWIQLERGHSA